MAVSSFMTWNPPERDSPSIGSAQRLAKFLTYSATTPQGWQRGRGTKGRAQMRALQVPNAFMVVQPFTEGCS